MMGSREPGGVARLSLLSGISPTGRGTFYLEISTETASTPLPPLHREGKAFRGLLTCRAWLQIFVICSRKISPRWPGISSLLVSLNPAISSGCCLFFNALRDFEHEAIPGVHMKRLHPLTGTGFLE